MTVGELTQILSKLDPNVRVVVHGYEGGYDSVSVVEKRRIALDVHDGETEWFYGNHDDPEIYREPTWKSEEAVLIGGRLPIQMDAD